MQQSNTSKNNTSNPKLHKNGTILCAIIFLLLAGVFRFVLIGYQTMVLLFLGLAVFTLLWGYAPQRWMRVVLAGGLVAGVVCIGVLEVPILAAAAGDAPAETEYVIVLGAGVNGSEPSLILHDRLVKAQQWLTDHPDSKAILSGGQGADEDLSEAMCMYLWLTERGIAGERLIREEQSTSTQENFQYSAAILQEHNGGELPEQVAVISNEFHLYRAAYWAERAGLQMVGVPAKTSLPVLRVNYFLREAAAVARLWVLGH